MQKYVLWFILTFSLSLTACNLQSQQTAALTAPTIADCPITPPPDPRFIPPEPYPEYPSAGMFWVGDAGLWTAVPINRTWEALPHDDRGYTQKLFWWSQKYAGEIIPDLSVTGQQLDGEATFKTTQATNASHPILQGSMLTGAAIPTAGCWQITGSYAGQELSYVVWVAP